MPPAARAGGWLGAGGRSHHLQRYTGQAAGRIIHVGPETRESERGGRDHASLWNTIITRQPLLPR
jgi:hypothetical protein